MKKLIIGNWKMHGRISDNNQLLRSLVDHKPFRRIEVAVAVPSVYVFQAEDLLANSDIRIAAQDVSRFSVDGAYTGENSAAMLNDLGVFYVLIGHSERRQYFGENNDILSEKYGAVVKEGLVPVLCVGETQAERNAGIAEQVISQQLEILSGYDSQTQVIVAYEPVWAIGSGNVATVEQITAMHTYIKNWVLQKMGSAVSIRVLYGGSVKEDNAVVILSNVNVDGALVGGASLKTSAFLSICEYAEKTEY